MKRILLFCAAFLFLIVGVGSAVEKVIPDYRFVGHAFTSSQIVNDDWLADDFSNTSGRPVKFGVLIGLSVTNIVNFTCSFKGTAVTHDLNNGVAIAAGVWKWFSVPMPQGVTGCNLQSETNTSDVDVFVFQTSNLDL